MAAVKRSSGVRSLKDPLRARPIGVRLAAMITTSSSPLDPIGPENERGGRKEGRRGKGREGEVRRRLGRGGGGG